MPKASSLTDDILGGIEESRRGPAGWFSKLPAAAQEELVGVRDQFRAGKVGANKHELARSIHAALAARGLIAVTWREVVRWLNGD